MSRSPEDRLNDILVAISNAVAADQRLREADAAHDVVGVRVAFDAILHNLFVIGEAAKSLPNETLSLEPGIPWRDIVGMRNVLSHQYHRVVPSMIHATVRESLGPLEVAVERMLSQLPGDAR